MEKMPKRLKISQWEGNQVKRFLVPKAYEKENQGHKISVIIEWHWKLGGNECEERITYLLLMRFSPTTQCQEKIW